MNRLADDRGDPHWTFAAAKAHSQLAYMDHLLREVSDQVAVARARLGQSRELLEAFSTFEAAMGASRDRGSQP